MKRKGFTLVELLAVIVILAVILAIAVPSVNNIISNSKLNSFNASSDMLERAARAYMGANNITVASGATLYILYTDMKNAGYIGKVSDPTSNNECTHSGVYVTNNSGTYTYTGALACDNYIDIDAYNLITNSNFSNGTTGWAGSGATLSAANNILSVTGSGGLIYGRADNLTSALLVTSHKIYLSSKVKVTSNVCNIIWLRLRDSNYLLLGTAQSINLPSQNYQYKLSGIVTVPATFSGNIQVSIQNDYSDATTASGKVMQIDGTYGVYAFDLTAIYGVGNEPTQAQIDNIMSNMGK